MRLSPLTFVRIAQNYVEHKTGHFTLACAVETHFPGFIDEYCADPFIAGRYDANDAATLSDGEFFTNVLSFFCLPLPYGVVRNAIYYHAHLALVKELRARLVLARRVARSVMSEQILAENKRNMAMESLRREEEKCF